MRRCSSSSLLRKLVTRWALCIKLTEGRQESWKEGRTWKGKVLRSLAKKERTNVRTNERKKGQSVKGSRKKCLEVKSKERHPYTKKLIEDITYQRLCHTTGQRRDWRTGELSDWGCEAGCPNVSHGLCGLTRKPLSHGPEGVPTNLS